MQNRSCEQNTTAKAQSAREKQILLKISHTRDKTRRCNANDEATNADDDHRRELRLDHGNHHFPDNIQNISTIG